MVRGRVVGTTAEHPFYVVERNEFVAAGEIEIGETFISHDGQLVQLSGVNNTGRQETVYNFRIADFHTYFVGGKEWGFSVWVHNAKYRFANDELAEFAERYAIKRNNNEEFRWRDLGRTFSRQEKNAIRNFARDNGLIRGHEQIRRYGPNGRYADFSSVAYEFAGPNGSNVRTVTLPADIIGKGRARHEEWLNGNFFDGGTTPVGWVWHHMAERGQMQLAPAGLHKVAQPHSGLELW